MPAAELNALLIPGTDADIIANYASLSQRAQEARWGFEDDVVILDTETTGLSLQRDAIIEVAAARLRGPEIVARYTTFVNPQRPISEQITELTGISDADVAEAPLIPEVLGQLAKFVGATPLVAHNAEFDRGMLQAAASQPWPFLDENTWVDSAELARIALPRCRSHALPALSAVFCTDASTHRGGDDVTSLAELWRVLLVALSDLPVGLLQHIANLFPQSDWPLRRYISQVAGSLPEAGDSSRFALIDARRARYQQRSRLVKQDALEVLNDPSSFQLLDLTAVAAAFQPDGLLGQMYAGYELRSEQSEMAQQVAAALNSSTHLAVEAGTGVGKSMAYLLPLAKFARQNGICCGVATKTNTLLDQLLYSELPRLAAALPDGLIYEALKGYEHYPCLRKLSNLSQQQERLVTTRDIATVATLLTFVCQSSRGDLDHLRLWLDELARLEIVASAEDCLKRRCRYYQYCLLHGARRAAAEADIVLTNQALLFCDITTDGGILPPIRHWVVDEAHGAADEARHQLSQQLNARELLAGLDALLSRRGALNTLRDTLSHLADSEANVQRVDAALSAAAPTLVVARSFVSNLKDLALLAESSAYDQVELWINAPLRESGAWADFYSSSAALSRRLQELCRDCQAILQQCSDDERLAETTADLAGLTAELERQMDTLNLILLGDDPSYVYSAKLDRRPEQLSDTLVAARLDVGEVLAEQLYPRTLSVIFTSATLATGHSFDYFSMGIGLTRLPTGSWRSLQLTSSYDLEHHMTIYLPKDLPEPNQAGYSAALEELLWQTHRAVGGSVLTLFTNRREMEDMYDRLHDRLSGAGIQLICQWRRSSTQRLSEQFLANRELSLFALRSFWQGFDAPGDTLRCVIIPKLPFSRPTDPLGLERSLRERDSWKHYVLPEAIIDLRQAAGRLIRSTTDRGALVLADSRLLTKWYGAAFLEALPTTQLYTLDTASIADALVDLGL